MLKNKQARQPFTYLLAGLLIAGLLLGQSVRAAVTDSGAQAKTTQEVNSPKQDASSSQPRVSPYAKMNRERAQANADGATKTPQSSSPAGVTASTKTPHYSTHAARKGTNVGAKKN